MQKNKSKTRPGYKQTPIGEIPMDWECVKLKKCLIRKAEYGINAPAVEYSSNLPAYIRITDISDEGKYISSKKVSVKHPDINKFFLKKNDILFARTGATTGKTYLYNNNDGALVFASFLIRVRPNINLLIPAFLKNFTTTSQYWKWVVVTSQRSGQPGINGNEYSNLPIPLPPISEQKKIAEILSTWNKAIEQTNKLIEKKELLKKGLMQQLLSGQLRFPKYRISLNKMNNTSENWKYIALKNVSKLTTGGTPSTRLSEYWNGNIPWMNSGDLNKKKISEVKGMITEKGLKNSSTKMIKKFSILVGLAGQGKTRGTVAINEIDLCINQSIAAIIPDKSNLYYLYLYFNLENRYEELRKLSTGDGGRGGLNLRILRSLKIHLPLISEQKKIAKILSNCDEQIETLRKKEEALIKQKKGLMQKLLTGKIRVNTEER